MNSAVVVHQIPGRVRMRIAARRGDAGYFSKLNDELRSIEGVRAVSTNHATSSVVLQHEGELRDLVARIRERNLDFSVKTDTAKIPTYTGIRPVRIVSGRNINPMFMLGSTMIAMGVVQVLRGRIAVPAIASLWYAREAFRSSWGSRR